MLGFSKKNKELEAILLKLHANASNNYKDAAQDNYRDFLQKYEELKTAGKMKSRQIIYYEEQIRKLEPEMKNYTHYDQKADFSGLGKIKSENCRCYD